MSRLAVILPLLAASIVSSKVVQVQVVHRHGDRTGLNANNPKYLPSAKTDWNTWTGVGQGDLTGVGMYQAEKLGQYLGKKYVGSGDSSVLKDYDSHWAKAWSTPVDRTLQTAQCMMRGMFGTKGPTTDVDVDIDGKVKKGTKYDTLPFPIYSEKHFDAIMSAPDVCPAFTDKKHDLYNTTEWTTKAEAADTQALLKLVMDKTGLTGLTLENFYNNAYDALQTLHSHNQLKNLLPDLEKSITDIQNLAGWAEYHKYMAAVDESGKHILGGPILNTILKNMQNIVDWNFAKPSDDAYSFHGAPQFQDFSAHDTTLLAMAAALQLEQEDVAGSHNIYFKDKVPPYASAFIFELLSDKDSGDFTVNLHWRDGTTGEVHPANGGSVLAKISSFDDFKKHVTDRSFASFVDTPGTMPRSKWGNVRANEADAADVKWCTACQNSKQLGHRNETEEAAACLRGGFKPATPPPASPPPPGTPAPITPTPLLPNQTRSPTTPTPQSPSPTTPSTPPPPPATVGVSSAWRSATITLAVALVAVILGGAFISQRRRAVLADPLLPASTASGVNDP